MWTVNDRARGIRHRSGDREGSAALHANVHAAGITGREDDVGGVSGRHCGRVAGVNEAIRLRRLFRGSLWSGTHTIATGWETEQAIVAAIVGRDREG